MLYSSPCKCGGRPILTESSKQITGKTKFKTLTSTIEFGPTAKKNKHNQVLFPAEASNIRELFQLVCTESQVHMY